MNNRLEREITVPSILKFTFPSIIMMVIMSLYTVVDGTFVSRLIGTDAFSAVNIVYPLMSAVSYTQLEHISTMGRCIIQTGLPWGMRTATACSMIRG